MPKTWRNGLEKSLTFYAIAINSITKHLPISDTIHLVISKNLFVTELVLKKKTSNGLILITGCSHTGIDRIARNVHTAMEEKIYALLGGFHLFRPSIKRIHKISDSLKKLQVKIMAPCSCTDDKALNILKKEFSENFLINGIGAEYLFDI